MHCSVSVERTTRDGETTNISSHSRSHEYGRAFQICRTHRIDLNILCDVDLDMFLRHLSTFVEQVPDQDHLNLFLSSLKADGQGGAAKTNQVCDALRQQLETIDPTRTRYLNTILTAHVRKQPPHYEAALELLRDVKGEYRRVLHVA